MILVKGKTACYTLQFEKIFEEVNHQSQFIFHINTNFKKVKYLPCLRPCSKHFTCIILFNPYFPIKGSYFYTHIT